MIVAAKNRRYCGCPVCSEQPAQRDRFMPASQPLVYDRWHTNYGIIPAVIRCFSGTREYVYVTHIKTVKGSPK